MYNYLTLEFPARHRIPEMYELAGPPFRVDKRDAECLVDGAGERIKLMGASRSILAELATDPRWRDVQVAYVSRTEHPQWAAACLKLFTVGDGVTLHALAAQQEIYPGGKKTHFRRIHERTGISYDDMLFFDNEVGAGSAPRCGGRTRPRQGRSLPKTSRCFAAVV
jgi:magnesium-dependent phosphatase 1